MNVKNRFSALVQNYFCQSLINQRHVSERTIESYRDTFRLLFEFAKMKLHKNASLLSLDDLNADFIVCFLNYLEEDRHNAIRSRNIRLAAIRSFLHYVSYQEPESLSKIQRVLAIPFKRYDRKQVGFLTTDEMSSIINAVDQHSWSGQRDHVLLSVMYNTGARVSEMISAKREDLTLGHQVVIKLHGKGRKERTLPLWKSTGQLLRHWLNEIDKTPNAPLFPNRFGHAMTRAGIEERLHIAAQKAQTTCASLKDKPVSPHIIRHTTAMHLLQSGVDLTVIALWLGHERTTTTHQYMEADVKMKERILDVLQAPKYKNRRKPISDDLLTFLESL